MANEATVRASLTVRAGQVTYQNPTTTYRADMAAPNGPTPGSVTCGVMGTDINLAQLVEPGLCHLKNLDAVNYVEVGIWDPAGGTFTPFLELLPGEFVVVRLTRNLGEQYASGAGTDAPTRFLRIMANTAPCKVLVEAFER